VGLGEVFLGLAVVFGEAVGESATSAGLVGVCGEIVGLGDADASAEEPPPAVIVAEAARPKIAIVPNKIVVFIPQKKLTRI